MSKSTDELVNKIAPSKKNKNQKGTNVKKTIILTVVATLLVVASYVAVYSLGVHNTEKSQRETQAMVEKEVVSRVQSKN